MVEIRRSVGKNLEVLYNNNNNNKINYILPFLTLSLYKKLCISVCVYIYTHTRLYIYILHMIISRVLFVVYLSVHVQNAALLLNSSKKAVTLQPLYYHLGAFTAAFKRLPPRFTVTKKAP